MKITGISIRSFGVITDREFEFAPGANVIEGGNECGKTSLALFIKFMLYGLDGKKGSPTEKERFINWQSGCAAGVMEFTHEGKRYRLERSVGDGVRETKKLTDMDTLTPVKFSGEVGEYLFGVPESVFLNTVFVRQGVGSSVDAAEVKNAVANILSSADEKISVEKIQKKLDAARTKLRHKNSVGGRLREIAREIEEAENELSQARKSHGDVISATNDLNKKQDAIAEIKKENERLSLTLTLYDDLRLTGQRERMREALRQLGEKKKRLGELERPDALVHSKIADMRARLKAAHGAVSAAEDECAGLSVQTDVRFTSGECDADSAQAAALESRARSAPVPAIILIISVIALAAVIGVGHFSAVDQFSLPLNIVKVLLAAAICFSAVMLVRSWRAKKKLRAILARWGADSTDELHEAIGAARDAISREHYRADALQHAEEELERARAQLADAEADALGLCAGITAGDVAEDRAKDAAGDMAGDMAKDMAKDMAADTSVEGCLDEFERRTAEAEKAYAALEGEYKEMLGACNEMERNLRSADFSAIDERLRTYGGSAVYSLAASMDEAQLAEAQKKLKFNSEKIRALEAQCDELKRTAYSSPGHSPAELEERLGFLRAKRDDGELRLEALELAMDTISGCSNRLRQNLIPQIAERASGAFAAATAGRHDRLALGEDFSLRCSGEDGVFGAEYLSSGGADAAYVCLRHSLTPALYRREAPPAIYDESFSSVDEERTLRLISLIAAGPGQSLIFTCRSSDADRIAGALSPAVNVIRM